MLDLIPVHLICAGICIRHNDTMYPLFNIILNLAQHTPPHLVPCCMHAHMGEGIMCRYSLPIAGSHVLLTNLSHVPTKWELNQPSYSTRIF